MVCVAQTELFLNKTGDGFHPRADGQHLCRGQQDLSGSHQPDLRDDGPQQRRKGHPRRVRHLLHHAGGSQTIPNGICLLTSF